MKSNASIMLFPLCLFIMGCSEPQVDRDTWYDQQKRHSERRQEYVNFQVEQGIPEVDAKREFDIQYWIGRTRSPASLHPVERSGDDLEVLFDEE